MLDVEHFYDYSKLRITYTLIHLFSDLNLMCVFNDSLKQFLTYHLTNFLFILCIM